METVDYPTRAGMIEALMHARSQGIKVDVVGNGRTLRFPAGYGASDAPESPVEPAAVPVAAPTAAEPVESHTAPAEDEEDLIGVVPPTVDPEVAKFVNEGTVEAVLEAVESGLFTAEQAVLAEQVGKQRKGILALAEKEEES